MISAKAYHFAKLWRSRPRETFLVACPTYNDAKAFADDLAFFSRGCVEGEVVLFPTVDTHSKLPVDKTSVQERLAILYKLSRHQPMVVAASVEDLSVPLPATNIFDTNSRIIKQGDVIDRDELINFLVELDYTRLPTVEDKGEFAVRGGIVDIFSPLDDRPVRIELDDDVISSMRAFDPVSQRSSFTVGSLTIILAGSAFGSCQISILSGWFRDSVITLDDINDGGALPIVGLRAEAGGQDPFKPVAKRILDWLDEGSFITFTCHTQSQAERLRDLLGFHELGANIDTRPFFEIIPPTPTFSARGGSPPHNRRTGAFGGNKWGRKAPRKAAWPPRSFTPWGPRPFTGDGGVTITIGRLSGGFIAGGLVVVRDEDIFGPKIIRRPPPAPIEAFLDLAELDEGDLVVHQEHGIGRFNGLKNMEIGGAKNDFVLLEYLGGDKLYLPVWRMNLIERYIGPPATTLDRLGGGRWRSAQKRAEAAIRLVALELVKLYAARKAKPGYSFSGRDMMFEEFEAAFEYDETPDQINAVEDVIKDMEGVTPMDRLIAGDVGYGKTEVAMRAAFRAVSDGKQVAVLVPTTVLAFQHYETFVRRLKDWPARIEMLSRFRSRAEQAEIVKEVARGAVNIVIGTHRLLGADVAFHDLGLLIIDEEHRFGVRHKETIRKLKVSVDAIAMSATPIPRTLHMSLTGMRDISVISTPPQDRLAIRTYVVQAADRTLVRSYSRTLAGKHEKAIIRERESTSVREHELIKEAITNELSRGGQVFFVHNRIETIGKVCSYLNGLLPNARIGIAHGRLNEHELEDVMIRFLMKELDILLCTSIIGSGLDITNANTIIIDRADTFGLADLYQLRGRVGRSNRQAYAYLLVPEGATGHAMRRLRVLEKATEFGAGFRIAMHDLEVRGAGHMLGLKQSGHMDRLGYGMYMRLLDRHVRRLKGEPEPTEVTTEIRIPVAAYIPADYVEDESTRLVLYRRLASVNSTDAISAISEELADRFGPPPRPVQNLIRVAEIGMMGRDLGIELIEYGHGALRFKFNPATKVDRRKIIGIVDGTNVRLIPDSIIEIRCGKLAEEAILREVKKFLLTWCTPSCTLVGE